jgi:5-formyltetrahydrofolate cyclo-ligase
MESNSDILAEKARLRERLRFRRRHFTANLDGMAALAAFRTLPAPLSHLLNHGNPIVSAYAASKGEPDILPLMQISVPSGRLAMPFHAARDEHMGFRLWNVGDALENGPWRTAQPAADSTPATPDIIFCPLLGFDRHGGRLGQGGGHYDRYFSKHLNALRIGVGWSIQEFDRIACESTDIPLDAILTEQEYIQCGERAA